MNEDILAFRHRARSSIRSFFEHQGFIELDTPYLLPANTPDLFIDPICAGGQQLHTSPEIWMKRGLSLGLKKIYQMARVFRDDPAGPHHSKEFTMLEWYRAGAELADLVADCEEIFKACSQASGAPVKPFLLTDLNDLFKDLAHIDLPAVLEDIAGGRAARLQEELGGRGEQLPSGASFSDAFFHIMLKYIEPELPKDQPVVISRWPIQLAALSAACHDDPNYCDRFEIYYRGMEIANAYQECIEPEVLRGRFVYENRCRATAGRPCFAIDEEFLASVGRMDKTAGIALGVDRLFQAMLRKGAISEVIFGCNSH